MSSAPNKLPGARAWRSLGARIAAVYVVVTVGSTAVFGLLVAYRAGAQAEDEGRRNAQSTVERYRVALERGGVDALRALTADESTPSAVRLVDARSVELLAVSSASPAEIDEAREGRSPLRAPPRYSVAVARVSEGRRLEVVVPNDVGVRLWAHAWKDAALIFACGLAAAVAGAFLISRRALRPLRDLAQATQRIVDSGDLGVRVPERGVADLDELTRLFNRMLTRNESLIRAMRQSLDNVAHDLRTPLTRLRTGAELALANDGDAREALADTVEESDRVLAMLTTLMDITEAETGAMRLRRAREDLASIAREAVELYEHVSIERGVRVVTQLSPGVAVFVDRQRVLNVAANLLDNAIKYTDAGGHVEVSVVRGEGTGDLVVKDNGRGIAPADQPHVWERLFRGDRSRTERGVGLGLSLVKAIVEAHGGTVDLASAAGAGSTFTVHLPLEASQSG